ncbi:MAG: hypothetical protein QXO20_08075 [Candidatus Bathyarchaeia archaeon]
MKRTIVFQAPSQAGSQLCVYTSIGHNPSLFSQAEVAKLVAKLL